MSMDDFAREFRRQTPKAVIFCRLLGEDLWSEKFSQRLQQQRSPIVILYYYLLEVGSILIITPISVKVLFGT